MPGLAHFCEHLLFLVCFPEQYCPYRLLRIILISLIYLSRALNSSPRKMLTKKCVNSTTLPSQLNNIFVQVSSEE